MLVNCFWPADGLGTAWDAYITGVPEADQTMLVTDHGLPPGAPPEVITLKLTCPEIRFCEPETSWMLDTKFSVGFCSPVPGIEPLAPVNDDLPLVAELLLTSSDEEPATVPVADQVLEPPPLPAPAAAAAARLGDEACSRPGMVRRP